MNHDRMPNGATHRNERHKVITNVYLMKEDSEVICLYVYSLVSFSNLDPSIMGLLCFELYTSKNGCGHNTDPIFFLVRIPTPSPRSVERSSQNLRRVHVYSREKFQSMTRSTRGSRRRRRGDAALFEGASCTREPTTSPRSNESERGVWGGRTTPSQNQGQGMMTGSRPHTRAK
jgi:hypothetical protein